MPKTILFSFTTGIPEIFFSLIIFLTSDIRFFGPIVIGFTTIPDSYFLTFKTSSTWDFIDIFLCKHDTPPSCAIAIASFDSETVSIAAEIIGT